MYPKSLQELIERFRLLPGVGEKTAERYALAVTEMEDLDAREFATALVNVKEKLTRCRICGNLSESEECDICSDNTRNKKLIFVVQSAKDVLAMEKTNEFNGVYHVLNGAINFQKGIGVEDLNIKKLIDRSKDESISEIIIATNATLEGETTARYIKTLLEDSNCKVTRIAHGLPVGGDINYADEVTVLKALEGRRDY